MISRQTLFTSPGGDTTQMLETAAALKELGVVADIFVANDAPDLQRYDIVHFFNIIRPADILRHVKHCSRPFVVSTIFVEYGNEHDAGSMMGRLQRYISSDRLEYLKVIARRLKNGDSIGSSRYLFRGHRAAIREVARKAAMLLPNSHSEYRRFESAYGIPKPYRVIPNGVNTALITSAVSPDPRYRGSVVCMGRIEPRKNQLRLIQAMTGSDIPLFIHGKAGANHQAYYHACRSAAGPNCTFGGHMDAPELYAAYAGAAVHALPSFFETTGLSSLEAAAMGCNIVITDRGDQPEYFGDWAEYCDPTDVPSIREAVFRALDRPVQPAFRAEILRRYTWARAASETLAAYQEVLSA